MNAESKDLLLPAALVAVVGIMIFPMPSLVLDVLLMCNISFALLLLISAVYLGEPQKFTSLPTILLLSTLFRLGLNIATTRQILSGQSVPDIVLSFGSFVVGGNSVVGLVIFIIITLVQFLVIAKGSERVAEVAARFALDAMPGKQMSIDADIRNGLLSVAEARERRRELQVESKLFGALDGAMKFVKGDAIAGILITAINISAGFIVGVTQQNLALSEAIERFTIFTIGDGLVSQLPALLVSVAAGVVVTRVADGRNDFVGRDMLGQLTKEPQALIASAFVVLLLSMVPGLPALPFLFMACLMFLLARGVREEKKTQHRASVDERFTPRAGAKIRLKLSAQAAQILRQEQSLIARVAQFRKKEFQEKGVIVPEVEFEIVSSEARVWFAVEVQGVRNREVEMQSEELRELLGDTVIKVLQEEVERHLPSLLDDTHTRKLLELHQAQAEDLVNAVVPELMSVTQLTRLLRALVTESVRITELPVILQAISEEYYRVQMLSGPQGLSVSLNEDSLEGAVRIALCRSISADLQDKDSCVRLHILDEAFEQSLHDSLEQLGLLSPELIEEMQRRLSKITLSCLMVAPVLRKPLARVLRPEYPDVRIVAPGEIASELKVEILGRVCGTAESNIARAA